MATPKSSLNIGAGLTARQPGMINADLFPGPNIDVVFDASKHWPFKDNSISSLRAIHVLEHLPEMETFFREAHRVVESSSCSNIHIRLPYGPSEAGLGDVTHLRQYVASSFACFTPGWENISRNRQYDAGKPQFVLDRVLLMIDPRLRWWLRPVIRKVTVNILPFLWSAFSEMVIDMHKAAGNAQFRPVPLGYAMFENQYNGKQLRSGLLRIF